MRNGDYEDVVKVEINNAIAEDTIGDKGLQPTLNTVSAGPTDHDIDTGDQSAVAKSGDQPIVATQNVNIDTNQRTVPLALNDNSSTPFDCDSCCQPVVDNPWYRCSSCSEFDMCVACYTDNCHSEHKQYIHKFTDYVCDGQSYCDCCGIIFDKDENKTVYHCKKCQDFGLCETCFAEGMHANHKRSLRKIHLDQFMDVIR